MKVDKEHNYYKLLQDLKSCYEENVDRLEIPFPCLLDYPVDMPNKLTNLGFFVDITSDALLIKIKTKKAVLNKP